MSIGQRIAAERDFLGITQVELAQEIGLDQSRLSRLETGRTKLSTVLAIKIADALGLSLVRLTGRLRLQVCVARRDSENVLAANG